MPARKKPISLEVPYLVSGVLSLSMCNYLFSHIYVKSVPFNADVEIPMVINQVQ